MSTKTAHTDEIRQDRILILDFGGQYTQLIARAIRESGVYCEIYAFDVDFARIEEFAPSGIILSGGPETVTTASTPRASDRIYSLDVPVLGICYGMQTMAAELGGAVETADRREFGLARLKAASTSGLFEGLDSDEFDVWMSHGDRVIGVPAGFEIIAETDSAPIAAMADHRRRLYGVQFHPEVTHTEHGRQILHRFAREICGAPGDWQADGIIDSIIDNVRTEVGTDGVVLGLSGGVDSSVTAALLHRAIGDQLTCIFVDNGLLRLNEADEVMETFANHLGVRVIRVEAEDEFLLALAGVSDPEAKRKIIGETFVTVFEREAARLADSKWLAQGTIYPDVIESAGSATGKAKVIKSHHNVSGLPENMQLSLLEPLRMLFKDEVRKLGLALGLDATLINRHPFPGPGLGVRILGEVRREFADTLRSADAIYMEELHRAGWYDLVDQAFAVFLPVKSVGVVGDNRAYDYVVSLRAVQTVDFMTAKSARLPWDLLELVASRIINEVRGVSRVAFDISSKPPATIEWE